MKNVGQRQTANGMSDTLMLGSRKETLDGREVHVTVLYSKSGQESLWERFKLFLFGNSLKQKARQKIIDRLTENPKITPATQKFLQKITQAKNGVSASALIELTVQEKLSGVDLLDGIKVIHFSETAKNAEEISQEYLMKEAEELLNLGQSPDSIKELAKLLLNFGEQAYIEKKANRLFEPRDAQPIELEQNQIEGLVMFRSILSAKSTSSDVSNKIKESIDELLKKNAQSTHPLGQKRVTRDADLSKNLFVDISLNS